MVSFCYNYINGLGLGESRLACRLGLLNGVPDLVETTCASGVGSTAMEITLLQKTNNRGGFTIGTATQTGELPIRFTESGDVAVPGKKKEVREFNGRNYVMEESLLVFHEYGITL